METSTSDASDSVQFEFAGRNHNLSPSYGKVLSDRSLQNLKQVESTLAQIQSRLIGPNSEADNSEDKPKKSSEDKLSPNRIEKQLTRLMAMKSSLENFLPEELLEDIETLEMFEGLTSHLDTSKRCKLSSKVTRMIELTLPRFEIQKQELLKQSSLKKN